MAELVASSILRNSRVLILGGGGLVGSAIARHLGRLPSHLRPSRIIVAALRKEEAIQTVTELEKQNSSFSSSLNGNHGGTKRQEEQESWQNNKPTFVPAWGDIFVRSELAHVDPKQRQADPDMRAALLEDMLGDFRHAYDQNHLVATLREHKPQVVVDCINTATVISYQNVFHSAARLRQAIGQQYDRAGIIEEQKDAASQTPVMDVCEEAEKTLLSLSTPQLVRHVRMLQAASDELNVRSYLKIGTTGTGGMGLNIPYTHSEDRPSQVLLAKSEVAFGQSGLLMLWSQTPNAPSVKELKPAAAIGYKTIDVRRVKDKHGNSSIRKCNMISLPNMGVARLSLQDDPSQYPELLPLKMPVVDMGENGVFTESEFLTITAPGQMEMITPEEISMQAVEELLSISTGHNVISALKGAVLGPGYRAGLNRTIAGERLKLCHHHGPDPRSETATAPSVALGLLGPPQTSKLLFEAHILACKFKTWNDLMETDTDECAKWFQSVSSGLLNSQIVLGGRNASAETGVDTLEHLFHVAPSVGVPILLEGDQLVRGPNISVPEPQGASMEIPVPRGDELEAIVNRGWVDLRESNLRKWKDRASNIVYQRAQDFMGSPLMGHPLEYKSSRGDEIDPPSAVAWIFSNEFGGHRDVV